MRFFCYGLAGAVNLYWILLGDKLPVEAQMAVPVMAAAAAAAGVALRARELTSPARTRYVRRALWVLLGYYLAILSVLLFFGGLFHVTRGGGGAVNLKPFRTIRNFLRHYRRTGSLFSLSNLLGNLVLLFPFGVLMPVMFRPLRRFWTFLPLAAVLAAGVELVQWLTRTGVADVDDSILNFAGAALGYFAARLIQMLLSRGKKRQI